MKMNIWNNLFKHRIKGLSWRF